VPPPEAVARLHARRFPDRPLPGDPAAARAALLEREPVPEAQVRALAAARVEALRAVLVQAGIDPARLPAGALAAAPGGTVEGVQPALAGPELPDQPASVAGLLGGGARGAARAGRPAPGP
jgi:hypothetical protein